MNVKDKTKPSGDGNTDMHQAVIGGIRRLLGNQPVMWKFFEKPSLGRPLLGPAKIVHIACHNCT